MDSVGQEPKRAQRNRLPLFLHVWGLTWEDLEAGSSERAGRTGLPARAPTCGAPCGHCFLTPWQVQGGQNSYVGIGALRTSVPTHSGWELQLLLWPSIIFHTAFWWLHTGHQPQLQWGEEHGPWEMSLGSSLKILSLQNLKAK